VERLPFDRRMLMPVEPSSITLLLLLL